MSLLGLSATERLTPRAAHVMLHITVLLWGLTAILGRSISVSALTLVWYRTAIVVIAVVAIALLRGDKLIIPWVRTRRLLGVGVLVAVHWVMFYGCIKLAGVAIAVLCLSTLVFFTAIIEPVVFRRRLRMFELLLGIAAIVGVVLLLQLEGRGTPLGWAIGIGSSLFSATFGTINGRLTASEPAGAITLYELLGAWLATGLVLCFDPRTFVAPWHLSGKDGIELVALALVCTLLPWFLSLRVLKVLPPYMVAIAVMLEPVYAMILARVIWPETESLSVKFYIGSALLLLLGPLNLWLKKRFAS